MYKGFIHLHSSLRYVLLIFLVVTIINSILKLKKEYNRTDDKLSLLTFIFAHTQLLIGLGLYFMGSKGMSYFSMGMGEVMGNSVFRFFAVEHLVGMLVAIVLITVGRIKMKKLTDGAAKHKTTLIYYAIALILILVSIPWPFRHFGNAWI
ncbi:MAG: cytochrome B [Chitinophagales bacterium]|nr:cytochrome B [Chitinophagales bacterium]